MTGIEKKILIEMKDVSKTFCLESGTQLMVLSGVNLVVHEEECIALLGPSGSGKSTCLRIMAGLTTATSGSVYSRGKLLHGINPEVALVFQSFALFPWLTVYDNIELALLPQRLSQKILKKKVKKVIDLVGLEGFEEAYPRELSGGMKQRVGIARALVAERPVIFLDEPFSALDVLTADMLRSEIVKIFHDKKTATNSMVLVTHNIQEAVLMANRIMVMGNHPGYIRKQIINDLPYPRDEHSPSFLRMVSQIHTMITETLMPDIESIGALDDASMMSTRYHASIPRELPLETLPPVQMIDIIGLLEAIADTQGVADIFELAHETRRDFGRTLYLVKGAELLELVDTPKQKVVLTEMGKHFIAGDMNVRKRMLHELFSELRIVQIVTRLLKSQHSLRLPIDILYDSFEEWLPNENSHQIVESLISWGRFAEYFGYNDDTKEVYLDVGQDINE